MRPARGGASEIPVRKALALLCLAAACTHPRAAGSAATAPAAETASKAPLPPPPDPRVVFGELSAEARALLRAEGDLLWKRWTSGAGPLPSSAQAEHPRLFRKESLEALAQLKPADPVEAAALRLLQHQLETLLLARETTAETDALERARAALSFDAPGDARPERGERDLDRLLTDEPSAVKRAAIALSEARAAQALAPLAVARDAAIATALAHAGLGTWEDLQQRSHGSAVAELSMLAEQTLVATDAVAARAVAATAQRNLGVTPDRLRRADLPRLVRSAAADAAFAGGRALPAARAALGDGALAKALIDAEPSPSKGARPLALLVDPPGDVRLSLRPAGGFEEQRATLHEAARAQGGLLTAAPRWELAQLGDGGAAEAVAMLYEQLAGDPAWLRETTTLRGEPLDDLVHTQATRRVLLARRAAAMVLFEIRRRAAPAAVAPPAVAPPAIAPPAVAPPAVAPPAAGSPAPDATALLYRGLLQRATLAVLSDEDAGRWALESDPFLRAATTLQAAVASAQLERALRTGAVPAGWWHAPQPLLQQLWSQGRSAGAIEVARALGAAALDPAALAAMADAQLAYRAPEAPPPTERPDYKYMQGDKRPRRKRSRKRR